MLHNVCQMILIFNSFNPSLQLWLPVQRPSEKVKPSDIFEENTVCYVHFKGLNSDNLKSAGWNYVL